MEPLKRQKGPRRPNKRRGLGAGPGTGFGAGRILLQPLQKAREMGAAEYIASLERDKLIAQIALKREAIRRNTRLGLLNFSREVLGYTDIEESVHGELCRHLEDAYWGRGEWKTDENAVRRYLFLLPRGTFKTTIATVCFPIWIFCQNDPKLIGEEQGPVWSAPPSFNGKLGYNQRILLGSEIEFNATRFLQNIRDQLISCEPLRDLFGNLVPQKRTEGLWTASQANVIWRMDMRAKEANLTVTSMDGNPVGGHYDIGIMDDMISDKTVTNDEQIIQSIDWYRRMLPVFQEGNGSVLIFVGTRWHDKDLYGHFIEEEKDKWIVYKEAAERTEDEIKAGKPRYFFPTRLGPSVLEDLKTSMRPSLFSCQYYNDPILHTDAVFKKEYFEGRYYELPPGDGLKDFMKDKAVFITVDPAISKEKRGCYAVSIVVAWDPKGNAWILDLWRRQGAHPGELLDAVFDQHQRWRPILVGIEQDGFQRMYRFEADQRSAATGIWPGWTELKPNRRSKELRIGGLEPLFRAKKVWLRKDALQSHTALEDEALRWPRGRYRDILDAMAYQLDLAFPGSDPPATEPSPESQEYATAMMKEVHDERMRRLNLTDDYGDLPVDWMGY